MLLGRVVGTVVPALVTEGLEGIPLLIVQPLALDGTSQGMPLICADSTRMAGRNELVIYEGGREAAMALTPWFVPVDGAIIGLVDEASPTPSVSTKPQSKKRAR